MAYKVDLTATDQTGQAFESVIQNTAKLDSVSQNLDGTITELQQKFDQLEEELASLEQQEKAVGDAANRTEHAIEAMGDASGKSVSGIGSANDASSKLVATMFKLYALKETFVKIGQGISYLAEKGNPAAEGLIERFQKLQETLVKLAETEQFQYMLDGITGTIGALDDTIGDLTNTANDHESAMSQMMRSIQDSFNISSTLVAEYFGIVEDGTTETIRLMGEEREERAKNHQAVMEQKREQAAIEKQMGDVAKMEAELEKGRWNDQLQAEAKEISSVEELERIQKRELETLRDLAKQGKLTLEQQQESYKIIETLEARKKEVQAAAAEESDRLIQEGIEKEQAAAEQRTEEAKRQTEERKKLEAEAAKSLEEAEKKATELVKKEQAEREKAFQAHVDRLKAAAEKGSPDGKSNEALNNLFNGPANRRNAAKQVISDRQKEATDAVDAKYNSSRNATGELSKEDERKYKQELAEAKRNAKKEAVKDIRSGEADQELNSAQADMAQKMISQGEKSGQLSRANAEALKQTVDALERQENQAAEMRQAIDQQGKFAQQMSRGKAGQSVGDVPGTDGGTSGGSGPGGSGNAEIEQAATTTGDQAVAMGQAATKALGSAATVIQKQGNEIALLTQRLDEQSRYLQDMGQTSSRRIDQRRGG